MIYKAIADIKKGEDIYICDKCEKHTDEIFTFKDDEWIYCKKCHDYACDMGDLAAEEAMEREQERKYEAEEKDDKKA